MAVPSLTTVVTHSLPCTCSRTEQAARSLRRGLSVSPPPGAAPAPPGCLGGPPVARSRSALLAHVTLVC